MAARAPTHTHTQAFYFYIWSFLHFYGFILSLKPSFTLASDWEHPPEEKKSEKRGDEWKREINSAEHQSEKLILQDFLRCEMKNVEMKSEEANGDVYLEILIDMEFNYKIFNVGILN